MKLHRPAYFCRHVPIGMINYKSPVASLVDRDLWFRQLVADIEQHGLVNPLFIKNDREHDMCLMAGLNRIQALVELGWERVPAVIDGSLPVGVCGIKLTTLDSVQSYFPDGRARLRTDGLTFSFATLPETKTYPRAVTPYWPE